VAGRGEIDEAKAPVSERDAALQMQAAVVRAAMAQRFDHASEDRAQRNLFARQPEVASDSAHVGRAAVEPS
jgi:hypothetical protein